MKTYLDYWNFSGRPFENICREEQFFASRQHREALERLLYFVRDGNMGFGVLTGEIGCGKTMIINVLCQRLLGMECQAIHLENALGDFDELLSEIIEGMVPTSMLHTRRRRRVVRGESHYELIRRFREQMRERFTRLKRHMVVILDEAQQLSENALVELKNLTNFGGGGAFSIILAGQPELGELVRSLPQVDQRVGVRYHLMPLPCEEVGEYVDRRLSAVGHGSGNSAFTDEAKQALHEATSGIPREINRICKLALDRAFSIGSRRISGEIVESIAEDVLRQKAYAL